MPSAQDISGLMAMMPAFATDDAGNYRAGSIVDVGRLHAGVDLMIRDGANVISTTQSGEFKSMLQMPPGNYSANLPGVINTIDLAQSEEQRLALEFIYSYWALRAMLKASLEVKQLLSDFKKIDVSVDYMGHAELYRRVKAIENTPPP
jgi:hypothetical protein